MENRGHNHNDENMNNDMWRSENGSGALFGPDQNNNPHTGSHRYQWDESGLSDEESNLSMGAENYGNTDRSLAASNADEDREDDDDFTTNDYEDDADTDADADDENGDWGNVDPQGDTYDPDSDPSGPGSAV